MGSIEIKVVNSEIVRSQLRLVAAQSPKAVVLALNRAIENTKNEGVRGALSLYYVKRADINHGLTIKRASIGNLQASFKSKGARLTLDSFRVVSVKRGVPVQVSVKKDGGDKQLHTPYFGWLGKSRSGIFKRVEDGAYPIHTVFGVSAPQMIGEETLLAKLENFSNRKLEERLYHELSRLGGLK